MNDQPTIFTIAKKEIMDNTRNKNIIIVTIAFAVITVLVSYLGSLNSDSWNDLNSTIQMMMFFIQFMVPIIGLMLGYASVVGEIERGTMSALLAEPATRLEIIIGKFLGLGLVLSTSIFVGLLSAGLIISLNVDTFDFILYLSFVFYTIILGLVFISISMFFSSILKRRAQSIGMSIFSWGFFSFLWGIMLFVFLMLSRTPQEEMDGFFAINLFSPTQVFLSLISVNMGAADVMMPSLGLSIFVEYYPGFYNTVVFLIILSIWMIVPLILAYLAFNRRDV